MRSIYFLAPFLFLMSCATQRTPSGGDKDETAPVVVMASPEPMSAGFAAKLIEIRFDEFVKLQNVRDQVLISPPLSKAPNITLKGGKRLLIDFGDEVLRENTTYTINLGEAISDNNEGNLLKENVYLFSTGSYIDTLEVRGRIVSARYNDPCAGCLALLFPDMVDSLVLGARPFYVARSDAEGAFQISNLAGGSYRLFALKDLDADLRIDKNEALGFQAETVVPTARDTVGHVLRLFSPTRVFKGIKEQKWSDDARSITLVTAGIQGIPEVLLSERLLYVEQLDGRSDSLRYWFDRALVDPEQLIFDLDGELDTVSIGRSRNNEPMKSLEAKADLANAEAPLMILLSRPMATFNEADIHLTKDTVPVAWSIVDSTGSSMHLALNAAWEPGANYTLRLAPGAIKDVYGRGNDSLLFLLRCPTEKTFGVLTLNVVLPAASADYHLQLMDRSKKLIHENVSSGTTTWSVKYLKPGEYFFRVFIDEDDDQVWSTGDFGIKRQAEKVFMLDQAITVRSNWELEQEVIVDFKP